MLIRYLIDNLHWLNYWAYCISQLNNEIVLSLVLCDIIVSGGFLKSNSDSEIISRQTIKFLCTTSKRAFLWQLIMSTTLSWNCSLYCRTFIHPSLRIPQWFLIQTHTLTKKNGNIDYSGLVNYYINRVSLSQNWVP